jgi:hypothetical protein
MRILIAATAALGFAASPVLAQNAPPPDTGTAPTSTTSMTHHTAHHATHHATKHHASHCTCASHHKAKTHHHTTKTTTTTKSTTSGQ